MAVPTALQMTNFRPRIGIKNEMFVQPLATPRQFIVQQPPKIGQIRAYPDEIIRHLIAPPRFVRRQAILRLIHAHHKSLRMRARNVQCGLTYATTGVHNQRRKLTLRPRQHELRKCHAIVLGIRLLKCRALMTRQHTRQIAVDFALRTVDVRVVRPIVRVE